MSTPEEARLAAALAKHQELTGKAREQELARKMAERDEAAALAELAEVYGEASFEAGVELAATLKADYLAKLAAFEQAVQESA